jgi:hypothetical protein
MPTKKTTAPKAKADPPTKKNSGTQAKQTVAPKVGSKNPVQSPKTGGASKASKGATNTGCKQQPVAANQFQLKEDADIREQPHGAALGRGKKCDIFTVHGLAQRQGIYAEVHFGSHRRYIVAAAFFHHEKMLKQFGPPKEVNIGTQVTLAKWQVKASLGHEAKLREHPDVKARELDSLKPGHDLGVERLNGKNAKEQNGFVWVSRFDHRVKSKTKSGKTVKTFDHTGWILKDEIEPQPKT